MMMATTTTTTTASSVSSVLLVSLLLAVVSTSHAAITYNAVATVDPAPVISYLAGTSAFPQVFNPTWIEASSGSNWESGLLVRSQNCSISTNASACVACNVGHGGEYPEACSVLSFAPLLSESDRPQFGLVTSDSVVFAPSNSSPIADKYGCEDPRVFFDKTTGTYWMMYTAYGPPPFLALASTQNPTQSSGWTRYGAVFPDTPNSKSGAILLRYDALPHLLYWGAGVISIATSTDIIHWTNVGEFLSPRSGFFDSNLVESGPPPMLLSTGDYVFFYNSADQNLAYHPGWVILNGTDPTQIVARSVVPLISPTLPWMAGEAPFVCNVPNVVFLEAAHPTDQVDQFRVYFGGSDAVIGTALVQVVHSSEGENWDVRMN